jgi:hypothetical protein
VGGVGAAGFGVAHQFAIAVVGGDQQAPPCAMASAIAAQTGIHRFHRLDRGGQAAGMADHVRVGEVQDDHVVLAGVDRGDRFVGQFGGGHFRLQIVGGDFRGGDHDAVLTGLGVFLAAVEEIGDVRIFFRLGHAQLGAPACGDDLAQQCPPWLRRESRVCMNGASASL